MEVKDDNTLHTYVGRYLSDEITLPSRRFHGGPPQPRQHPRPAIARNK